MPIDLTRRELLHLAGAAFALAGCSDSESPPVSRPEPSLPDSGPPAPPTFDHGVASGDPTPSAVILWTRVTPMAGTRPASLAVDWEVSERADFSTLVATGTFVTTAQRDWTVKVDAAGLTAGSAYHYRFRSVGVTSPSGRTRTAPEGPTAQVRFAVCSCSNYAAGYFHAYRAMAARDDLDAVLHLGDYIYEYPDDYYGNLRRYEPSHELITLADYRARYAQCRRDADLQAVHARHPFVVVWDDHELANNASRDGAKEHMPLTEGSWSTRRAAATRAYMEWLPIREQPDGRIFRALSFGDLVHLVMLDTRLWGRDLQPRDRQAAADPQRQILGADQERWMVSELTRTGARWKVLGQQVLVGQFRGFGFDYLDVWEGYPAARARLFDAIRTMGVSDVVVLTGDIHASIAMDLTEDPTDPQRYDPMTGRGSVAIELVTPGISSPALPFLQGADPETLRRAMPHMKYLEATRNGFVLLELTADRAVGTWMYVGDVSLPSDATLDEGPSFMTRSGDNRLQRNSMR